VEKKQKEEAPIYQLAATHKTVAQRQTEEELRSPVSQQKKVVVVAAAAAGKSLLQPAVPHSRSPVSPQRHEEEASESFLQQQAHSPKQKTTDALILVATQTLVAEQRMEEKVIHQLDMPVAQQQRQLGHPSAVQLMEEQTKEAMNLQPAYS
jgi:late competence protein required for DNA uptake (superfamily II DNA/RNA helicase)